MTEAEQAYKVAEALIAEAKRVGANRLTLFTDRLTHLPPEIAALPALRRLALSNTQITDLSPLTQLTSLTTLYLGNTQITDLAPISQLAGLTGLWLNNTQITDLAPLASLTGLTTLSVVNSHVLDLRPLRRLANLADGPTHFGLNFKYTLATRSDPRIAEIAEIKDNATRARELFAYLENWVPPVPADAPEAPSFHVPDSGPISSGGDPLEGGDEDQEELRQDLVRKASVLIEIIGTSNELSTLSGHARHYQQQMVKGLPNIRLGLLYSAANSLRVAYEANAQSVQQSRFNDQLPPHAAAALVDLVETHALFFMGFPNAAEIHARMLAGLTGGRDRATIEAAEPIVLALDGKVTVLDPEDQSAMADDLAGAKGVGPSAEIAEKRLLGRIRNMVFAVARKAYSGGKAGGKKVMERDIIAFILGEKTAIGTLLKGSQGTVSGWVESLVNFLTEL